MEANSNLFKTGGYIGRRDYIFNLFHIGAILLIFFLPYQIYLLSNMETVFDFFGSGFKYFIQAPILLKIWVIIGFVVTSILGIINITKRSYDIFAENNFAFNFFVSFLLIFSSLFVIWYNPLVVLFSLLYMCFSLFLMIKKGEITGKSPYDYTKTFNWGAFFGTWLWGLFNRSYVPLWQLILCFTPWSFYFQIVCGMKGNEWAYKNKKWNDVEKFNKSQRNQSLIWAILSIVVIPILIFMVIFISTIALAISSAGSPDKMKSVESKMEKILDFYSDMYFTSREIGENENKFYVKYDEWKKMSFTEKKDVLEMAATISADVKNKKIDEKYKNEAYMHHTRKYKELEITKIYSDSDKNKLLGEFVMENLDNADFKSILKASVNAYRFYR